MKLSSLNTTVVVFVIMMLIMIANLIVSIHLSVKCERIEEDNSYEISRLDASIADVESSLFRVQSRVRDIESEIDM